MKKKIEGSKPKFTHLQGQKIVISYFERIKTKKKIIQGPKSKFTYFIGIKNIFMPNQEMY